jgi:hypothetical protein
LQILTELYFHHLKTTLCSKQEKKRGGRGNQNFTAMSSEKDFFYFLFFIFYFLFFFMAWGFSASSLGFFGSIHKVQYLALFTTKRKV